MQTERICNCGIKESEHKNIRHPFVSSKNNNMNNKKFIEAVSSGLRKMDVKPTHLILVADKYPNWEFDEPTISNIPIIKTHISVNSGVDGLDFPIIPAFTNLNEKDIFMQVVYFQKGFVESYGPNF